MPSHDACTSGTSRVLTVASFQRLKMEILIPAPAEFEVRSMIKLLSAQSIMLTEIHRQLCQVYGHTRSNGQQISCRSSAERCLIIIHLIARTSRPVIFHLFLHLKKFLSGRQFFSEWERGEECHTVVPIPGGRLLRQRDTKVGRTVWQMSQLRRSIRWKIAQHVLYLLQ